MYVANVDTDRGTSEKIRFIDTEGVDDDRVKELPRHLHAIADGFVIVYSADDRHSFRLAEAVRRDIERYREKKDLPIVVLANKADLPPKVDSSAWAGSRSAGGGDRLFEVSARDRASLTEPFVHLSSRLNPPPNKSTFSQLTIGRKQ